MRRTARGDWLLRHPWGVVPSITVMGAGLTLPQIVSGHGFLRLFSVALLLLCPLAGVVMWSNPHGVVRRRYVNMLEQQAAQ